MDIYKTVGIARRDDWPVPDRTERLHAKERDENNSSVKGIGCVFKNILGEGKENSRGLIEEWSKTTN